MKPLHTDTTVLAVVAYDAHSGREVWRQTEEEWNDSEAAIAVSPDGSRVVVTSVPDDDLAPGIDTAAYDAATGQRLWSTFTQGAEWPWSTERTASLSLTDDEAIVVGAHGVVGYDLADGHVVWEHDRTGQTYGAVSPDGTALYVSGVVLAGTTYHPRLTKMDPATGAVEWTTVGDEDLFMGLPDPIAVSPDGSTVYRNPAYDTQTPDKPQWKIVAQRADDGTTSWTTPLGDYHGYDPGAGQWQWSTPIRSMAVSPNGSRVYAFARDVGVASTAALFGSRTRQLDGYLMGLDPTGKWLVVPSIVDPAHPNAYHIDILDAVTLEQAGPPTSLWPDEPSAIAFSPTSTAFYLSSAPARGPRTAIVTAYAPRGR